MSEPKKDRTPIQLPLPGFDAARARWRQDYADHVGGADEIRNRSGIAIAPLYTPEDWDGERYMAELGFPGQMPATRGIYPSMHRGRPWSQRQLVGLATPRHYNKRLKTLLEAGADAISLIPCNSVYRGYDVDEVDRELLGTCGSTLNTVDDMALCLDEIPIERISIGLNDPSPFTLLAFVLSHAKRIGVPWSSLAGTSNQSDYISHFVANHMFFRLALPGARRLLLDEIEFMNRHVPKWNPVSVVGQHMQQAGATPAEAMGLTLSTAIQYTGDCIRRGMAADSFLPRLSFFFDISLSFFEEIAKFRAGRRVWARIVRERFGAEDARSWRFKFHSQTSGVDLTRSQRLNNISRVAIQAMAGIFGGTQSLHTDAHDEVLSTPTAAAARIAVNTQNILREEAHLDDVIDPLGGSYYLETLTNQMAQEIEAVIARIDDAGGMFEAVNAGLVQRLIGASALAFQRRVESGEHKVVGVNAYLTDQDEATVEAVARPDPADIEAQIETFKAFKRERDQEAARRALDALGAAANSAHENVFEKVVEAAGAGATHGEICARLRAEFGFGQPLVVA